MMWNWELRIVYRELFLNRCIILKGQERNHWTKTGEKKKISRVQTKTHINPNEPNALIPRLQSLGGFFPHFFFSGPMTFTLAGGTESAAV